MDTLSCLIGSMGIFLCVFVCVRSGRRCTEWKENAAQNENHEEEEEVLYLCCSWSPLFTDRGEQALLAICTAWPYFTDRRVYILWSPLCSSCGSYSVFKTRTTALFLSQGTQTCTPRPPKMFIDMNWMGMMEVLLCYANWLFLIEASQEN